MIFDSRNLKIDGVDLCSLCSIYSYNTVLALPGKIGLACTNASILYNKINNDAEGNGPKKHVVTEKTTETTKTNQPPTKHGTRK